ncbi:MAG: hypothetical protein A2549_03150 [Candidatus Staskawiczbacteria bacterium RIFOXYD2_FULL_37_10]|nr:MAG: hypothetical protein A2549_03150 [Candidatus Staskawiczbacteria bacterium RIFOXYD2_FULL_37_10]
MHMQYACTAATERNARCRHWVGDQRAKVFCSLHQQRKDAGEAVEIAPKPDVALYKFNLNGKWRDKLLELGVPEKDPDFGAKEAKHVAHAQQFGREAYAIRKEVADSGVPVFGKEGIQNVSLYETLQDLLAEYEVVDIHIRPRRDGTRWISVLVINFSHGGRSISNQPALDTTLEFLSSSCWGFCHVWANPPQDDGRIVHTINSSHREVDKQPELVLRLNGGLWSTEPYVEPELDY